jgi:hypothetical protein
MKIYLCDYARWRKQLVAACACAGISFPVFLPLYAYAETESLKKPTSKPISPTKLTTAIGECPPSQQSFAPAAPALAALAGSVVANLSGAAIDSAINYLTQEREATSRGRASLFPADLKGLFEKNNCLYVYLYTLDLWKYFNRGSAAPPAEGAKPISIEQLSEPGVLDDIISKKITSFIAVMSFEPAAVPAVPVGKEGSKDVYSYYRPYFWRVGYTRFLDTGCPAFRNCNKRDVALQVAFRYPIAPIPANTENRSLAFAEIYQGASPESISASLNGRYSAWFAYNNKEPAIANFEFTLIETSRPGAVANALAAALKANKDSLVKVVTP